MTDKPFDAVDTVIGYLEEKVPDDGVVGTFMAVDIRRLSRKALLGLVVVWGEQEEMMRERQQRTVEMLSGICVSKQ